MKIYDSAPQESVMPVSHLETVATRAVGIGLAVAVAIGGCVVAKEAYDGVHDPDYKISIVDSPAHK